MAHPVIKYLKKELQNKGSIIITPKIGKELVDFLEDLDETSSLDNSSDNVKLYKKVVTLTSSQILNAAQVQLLNSSDITNKGIPLTSTTTTILHHAYAYVHYRSAYTLGDPADEFSVVETVSGQNLFTFNGDPLTAGKNKLFHSVDNQRDAGSGLVYSIKWDLRSGNPTNGTSDIDIILFYTIIDHG